MKHKHVVIAGVFTALAVLAGCGQNDGTAQAQPVPPSTTTTASAPSSEVVTLPPVATATTEISTGVSESYTSLDERQQRFDAFYGTLSEFVASALDSTQLGGIRSGIAVDIVPDCVAPSADYDGHSEAIVVTCSMDGHHAVVRVYDRNGDVTSIEGVMLDHVVIARRLNGYYVSYAGAEPPSGSSLAELKQYDDEAVQLLKTAALDYFGESKANSLGLA